MDKSITWKQITDSGDPEIQKAMLREAMPDVVELLAAGNVGGELVKSYARVEKERRNKRFNIWITLGSAFAGSFLAGILVWWISK